VSPSPPHLKSWEKIERNSIPSLVAVLREESLEAVRYALFDTTNWHRDYDPCLWRSRATEEQKRIGWEMWIRLEKILATVLREAHRRQVEEAVDTLSEGPEGFYEEVLRPSREEGASPTERRRSTGCSARTQSMRPNWNRWELVYSSILR
jgi:hypothetical protein